MKYLKFVLFLFILFSCAEKDEKPDLDATALQLQKELDLNEVIMQTPPSIVSSTSTIDLIFRDPVIPSHMKGLILDENPFHFEPEISGNAEWQSERLLRFVPDKNLPAGIQIKATLDGRILLGAQKNVNNFVFTFKVAEQEVLSLDGDFVAIPDVKNGVAFKGMLTFAQPVSSENIKRDLSCEISGDELSLDIKSSRESSEMNITSVEIKRKKQGQALIFRLPSKYTAEGKEWEKEVYLPGIDVLRVLAHMDMTDPATNQMTYGFRFNEPIKKQTDLSGYINISPQISYQIRTKGKYLLVEGDFLPGQSYTVTIAAGFPSIYNNRLRTEYKEVFYLSNLKPKIEWLSRGIYLPTDNKFKLQFKSVNVRKVKVNITEIFPQNIGFFIQRNVLIDQEATADKSNYYYSPEYSDLSRVGENIYHEELQITSEKNKWVRTEVDLNTLFKGKKKSAFVVQLGFNANDLTGRCVNSRDEIDEKVLYYPTENYYLNPAKSGYYYRNGRKSKLLISSNIGLTTKRASDGVHVYAVDILRAQPVSNLELQLFTHQNKLVASKHTDAAGYVHFTEKGDYIYGKDDSGIALIKLNQSPWNLNNFNVSGRSGGKKDTDVFLYCDRDVHRPGDTIHLAAIVRINTNSPPEKVPVLLKVKNPLGQVVHTNRQSCGSNGHVYFPVTTELTDPTGTWIAELSVGDQKFTHILRVETIKPFRLKINFDLPDKVNPPDMTIRGQIASKYLFGAPASQLKINVSGHFSEEKFTPEKYPEYIFSSPLKKFSARQLNIYEGKLNDQGLYYFNYPLPDLTKSSNPLRARMTATVYEKGGGFTTQSHSLMIYPYTTYAGIKNIFASRSVLIGEKYQIPVIALGIDGIPVTGHRLKISVYVNRDHWWWDYDRREQRDFRIMNSTYLVETHTYTSSAKPVFHSLTIDDYGRHFIEVTDLTTGHESGIFFYASGWGQAPVEEEKRNYLQISSNQNLYNVGDQALLSFESPDDGMVVFTLEQGNKILSQIWKNVNPGNTSFSFKISKEMLPNCYASIFMIQPHNQNTNDVPMRLYGIKPIFVEDRNTHLPLTLEVPDKLRPKEDFEIQVTSSANRPATYTIAIVDEGLLDITGFQTPDPWQYFFAKIRLGITTSDNYDDILGVLYPDMDKYYSIGGGLLASERKKRLDQSRVRRFKPVVLFEKPVIIASGQTVRTKFKMPNYVGAVRVMVVGTGAHSYVSLEETIPVKQPLMLLPTVPRIVRPGDTFALPVSVFAMDKTIKQANISISTSANLSIIGESTTNVIFDKPGEKDTKFILKTGDSVGADSIRIIAVSGSEQAGYSVKLPVVSTNPFFTEVTDTIVQPNKQIIIIPEKFGLKGTNKARIAFSRIPDIQLDKRYSYLLRYPYGCIEQTVSSAFPQLFLYNLVDLKDHQKQTITNHINATIKHLSNFQISAGFSFWPNSTYSRREYTDWGSSYTGHFLVEAKALGYNVPQELYQHWLKEARSKAKLVNKKDHRYQAYRLFVLALSGNASIGAMNLLRENYLPKLDPLSRHLLAASYYLGGQKEVARDIKENTHVEISSYRELSGTFGSPLRDRALIAYLTIKMEDIKTTAILLREIYKSFRGDHWYSTQETAMTLLCIGTYYRQSPFVGGAVTFRVKQANQKEETKILSGYQMIVDLDNMWGKEIKITNESGNPLFVSLFNEGTPLDSRIKTEAHGLSLQRKFFNEKGQEITVNNRKQAKPFWVFYTVKSTHSNPMKELALSSVFPAGWEIVNPRISGEPLPPWVQSANISEGKYMDIRDDRVNWFFDLNKSQTRVFGIKINPTFLGNYALPPVVVEPMYSPEFYARIAGGSVKVN